MNPPQAYEIKKVRGKWRFYIDNWAGASLAYPTRDACVRAAWLHYDLFNMENV